jgi:hypothetical protein
MFDCIGCCALIGGLLKRNRPTQFFKLYACSQTGALVVIHKYLRDPVVLAGMPEPRHREVKFRVTQVR